MRDVGTLLLTACLSVGPRPSKPAAAIDSWLVANPMYQLLPLECVAKFGFDPGEVSPYFAAVASGDANGDHVEDVVAIVVRQPAASQLVFSVVAFHGRRDGSWLGPEWVVRDSVEPILHVAVGADWPQVELLPCYFCDQPGVFRWSKGRYVPEPFPFLLPGRTAVAVGEPFPFVFSAPSKRSRVLAPVLPVGELRVLEILELGPEGGMWYRVRSRRQGRELIGYLRAESGEQYAVGNIIFVPFSPLRWLRAEASNASAALLALGQSREVRILAFGPENADSRRWYKVEVEYHGRLVIGFMRGENLELEGA